MQLQCNVVWNCSSLTIAHTHISILTTNNKKPSCFFSLQFTTTIIKLRRNQGPASWGVVEYSSILGRGIPRNGRLAYFSAGGA